YSTVQHLDALAGTLTRLRRDVPFRLDVIGTSEYRLDGVDVLAKEWSAATEVDDIRRFDIGLMPLPDEDWAKGKCGLKLLQCMGLGIPSVASPVGGNRVIVQDGVNGFLAQTDAEWREKLTLLIRDPGVRSRVGRHGRDTVENDYSAAVWAPRVGEILES